MQQKTYAQVLRELADSWEANVAILRRTPGALEMLEEKFDSLPDYMVERNTMNSSEGCYTFDEWLAESSVTPLDRGIAIDIPSGEVWTITPDGIEEDYDR